jgi:hypothetical protein
VAERRFRSYKLKLSEKGFALFLECHCRLCRLVGDLLPYGTTLRVAVSLLDAMPTEELAAEVACARDTPYAGEKVHFMGTSASLARVAASLLARVATTGTVDAASQTSLFVAALACMPSADDGAIARVHARLRAADEAEVPTVPV